MPGRGRVIAVTSLALEARIASGPGVVVICCHASQLAASLQAAVRQGAAGIISFGIAGGLQPGLSAGDWVIGAGIRYEQQLYPTDQRWAQSLLATLPEALHAHIAGADAPIANAFEKRALRTHTGAAAADMESHIAARIAAVEGIPFAACRTIIDGPCRDLPHAAVVGLRPDGAPDLSAIFRSLAYRPGQLPAMLRLAVDACIARNALHRGRHGLGPGLACPYFSPGKTTAGAKSDAYIDPQLRSASS